jgi:hypothetical protein
VQARRDVREDRRTDEGFDAVEAGLQRALGTSGLARRRGWNAVWLLARESELLTLLLPSTQIESYGGEVFILGNRGATTQSLDVQPRNDAGQLVFQLSVRR